MTQPQNNFTDPYEMKRVYNNQRQSIVSVKKLCATLIMCFCFMPCLFLGVTKHLYNWLSIVRLVGWSVTHLFDDPHVAPYWPCSSLRVSESVFSCGHATPSCHVIKFLLIMFRGSSLVGTTKNTSALMIFHGGTDYLRLTPFTSITGSNFHIVKKCFRWEIIVHFLFSFLFL